MKIIEDKPDILNKYLEKGTPTFVFFYLNGCGPCEQTNKAWTKMKEQLKNDRGDGDEIIVARTESELIPKVQGKNGRKFDVDSFPSIHFISETSEPSKYDGDRSVESFISWVNENSPPQEGGYKRKSRRRRRKTKGKTRKHRRHRRKKRIEYGTPTNGPPLW